MSKPTIKIIIESDLDTVLDNMGAFGAVAIRHPLIKQIMDDLFQSGPPEDKEPMGFKQTKK